MQVVAPLGRGLEFERRMGDSGMVQEVFQIVFHLLHTGQAFEHDMGRQGVFRRTDSPDMDVVNGLHARNVRHLPPDRGHVDLPGNAVERQTQAVARQRPDRCHDHGGNDKPDDNETKKVKVGFITLDEKAGVEKRKFVQIIVQADDLDEALENLHKGMKDTLGDYEVASITETTYMDVFKYQINTGEEAK